MKKHTYIKLIFIIFVLLMITFSIWYHIPISKVLNINACSLEGDTGNIIINIKYYHYFFKPTDVRGTIIFNGITYVDLKTKGIDRYKNNNFITNLKLKVEGFHYYYFVNASMIAPTYIHDTILLLNSANNNYFSLLYTNNKLINGRVYYAPAITAKEAKEIQISAFK